jgi:hypothetical protein
MSRQIAFGIAGGTSPGCQFHLCIRITTKFDFQGEHWQELADQWVPELHMKVGAAISALKKSWAHYKIARRTGWADEVYELES